MEIDSARIPEIQDFLLHLFDPSRDLYCRVIETGLELIATYDKERPLIQTRYTFVPLGGKVTRVEIDVRREPVSSISLFAALQIRAMERQERGVLKEMVRDAKKCALQLRLKQDREEIDRIFQGLDRLP
jgi:hypothetical protein